MNAGNVNNRIFFRTGFVFFFQNQRDSQNKNSQ